MSQIIVNGIENIKNQLSGKRILLVRGGSFPFLSIKTFFDDIPYVDFCEFTPNPLYEQVVKGVEVFNSNNCDMIVAVGGGSAIDVAKCIKLFAKMDPTVSYLQQEKKNSGIPLIAVPTTAGTGAESTQFAVIYLDGVKQSISHPSLVSDIAVLEPSVLRQLPVNQKKCTMLDALCQAIESWWSVNCNDESKVYSKIAIETIRDYWEEYITDNTPEAAAKIMTAANYSGRAINITTTTAAHAMSYKLTTLYGIPHGHAVAISLPRVWRYMLKYVDKRAIGEDVERLKTVFSEIPVNVSWFEDLLQKLGITYPTAKNRDEEIEILVRSVDPTRLKNNPIMLDKETLKSMYEEIVK